jgi:hypothetical protein
MNDKQMSSLGNCSAFRSILPSSIFQTHKEMSSILADQ